MTETRIARTRAVDKVRGLIIILMTLDHVGMLIVRRHSSEYWGAAWTYYDESMTVQFLLRFLSHFCAPGFFLWMGYGIAKLVYSRSSQGWSAREIKFFLLTRGVLLVVISQLVETPAWVIGLLSSAEVSSITQVPGADGPLFINISVIFALGSAMAIIGLLPMWLHERPYAWVVVGAVLILCCDFLIPDATQYAVAYPLWARMLLIAGQSGPVLVVYPILPWLAISCFGVALGICHTRKPDIALGKTLWLGLALVVTGLALRELGGFGNIRLPRDASWVEFLNVIKYPPSIIFCCWMVGVNLLLLWLLSRSNIVIVKMTGWVEVFGKAPLFFYIAHLYLFAITGALFFRNGTNYAVGIAIAVMGLAVLYFGCLQYEHFKLGKPEKSFWRML